MILDYEHLLPKLGGEKSRFNLINIGLLTVQSAVAGILVLTNSFAGIFSFKMFMIMDNNSRQGLEPPWAKCKIPSNCPEHALADDGCKIYPLSNETGACLANFNEKPEACQEYTFGEFEYEETIITEFKLVCNEEYKVKIYTQTNTVDYC